MNDDKLIEAIRNRTKLPYNYLRVEKFLQQNNVGVFSKVCLNRIWDRLCEWDSLDDVTIDIANDFDMCLTESGVKFVKDILCDYVSRDIVNAYIQYIEVENRVVDCRNTVIETLRNCTNDDLKRGLVCPPDIIDSDDLADTYKDLIRVELKARQPLYMAYTGIKNKLGSIWLHFQNRHKLRAFTRVISRYE